MATIISVSFTAYQQIRDKTDNLINEYRDFAVNGVPGSPTNGNTYLARTTGSGFTIGRLYVYYSSVFYECLPCNGFIFDDNTNLYQVLEDGTIKTLSSGIYNSITGPLDMNGTAVNNVSAFTGSSASIASAPITLSSYTVANISSTVSVAIAGIAIGVTNISGFTSTSSTLTGTINNTGNNVFTAGASGIFAIHVDVAGFLAASLGLEINNNTTGKVLGNGISAANGAGVSANYTGFLTSGNNIQVRVSSNIVNVATVPVVLQVTRIS